MRFEIQKLDGYTEVKWNGTVEDLEGFNVRVTDSQINNSNHFGRVENGYAVAGNRHSVAMISKALREIR